MEVTKDYYGLLGCTKASTKEEIRLAYRKLSLKFHPDKNNGDKFFEERFKEICNAYEILSDEEKRRAYDTLRSRNSQSNSSPRNEQGTQTKPPPPPPRPTPSRPTPPPSPRNPPNGGLSSTSKWLYSGYLVFVILIIVMGLIKGC